MPLPEITEDKIRDLASRSSYYKGCAYFEAGSVVKIWVKRDSFFAHVQGGELYTVTITEKNRKLTTTCTCPYDWGGVCKHIVAVMLAIQHGKKVEQHERDLREIERLIEKVEVNKLKKFLLEMLSSDEEMKKDFIIFARGKQETEKSARVYKEEILALLERLDWNEYYHSRYHDEYGSPLSDILDPFSVIARKYTEQKNYREAIKIYQGICDACIEKLRDEALEDFYDDISLSAKEVMKPMAENVRKLTSPLKDKAAYFDYLLQTHLSLDDPEFFEDIFSEAVRTREEADYILRKTDVLLIPPIIFNLLVIKGDEDAAISFGEKHHEEYPVITFLLVEMYLRRGLRDRAVETAEQVIEKLQGREKDFHDYNLYELHKKLRKFLDTCYEAHADHSKKVENLIMLLCLDRNVEDYQRLREILKTEQERKVILKRLNTLLKGDYALLFNIYSKENDYKRLLTLARESIDSEVFHLIVKKIRGRYRTECFELYRKKIDSFLEDPQSRNAYRQVAYWLKLMREIPGNAKQFSRYINTIRTKYKRRPALMEEIEGI
jgi:tetratricopeptide (TPR) repeat protein